MTAAAMRNLAVLDRLFRWWVGELTQLVPQRLRRGFAPAGDKLVLYLGDNDIAVCRETRQSLEVLGHLDPRDESGGRLATLLRRHGLGRDGAGTGLATLRLPAERALRTEVDLPLAAEANLGEVVSFELDRHTPFRAEQALFAYRVIERDSAGQRLRIDLTVVPRPLVEQALAAAQHLGLAIDRVDVAQAGGALAGSGNLLPTRAQRRLHGRRERATVFALTGGAALLALVAAYMPLYQLHREAAALAQEFAVAKHEAASAAVLQGEIDALRKDQLFLVERKRARPTVSGLLLETTRLLPDDSWLQEWQLSGNEVQLMGSAGSASGLISRLEQSHVFRNSTFQSPVVQDTQTGRERFHISTQIVGEGDGG